MSCFDIVLILLMEILERKKIIFFSLNISLVEIANIYLFTFFWPLNILKNYLLLNL